MRLHKKKNFQRAKQNQKRLNQFNILYRLLLFQNALRKAADSELTIDKVWANRIALAKRLGKEKESYVDPNTIEKAPLEITPFLVSPEVLDAAKKENVPLVEKMIEEAVRNDDVKLVEKLVFRNVPRHGQSRLSIAFQRGYLSAAQYFVDKGDDIEERNNRGQTLFHWQAKQMSASGSSIMNDKDYAKIEFLLRNNANPHLCDSMGYNPVSYAGDARFMFVSLVQNITAELQYERAQKIKIAFMDRDLKTLEKLVYETLPQKIRKTTPRIVAALDQGYEDVAFLFANAGDDVDIRNENGETLLFVAAAEMDLPRVCALLRMNAYPDAPDKEGSTPLMAVAYNRDANPVVRREIIRELLEAGADDTIFDRHWNSAHSYAKTGDICLRDEIQQIKASIVISNCRTVLDRSYYIDR